MSFRGHLILNLNSLAVAREFFQSLLIYEYIMKIHITNPLLIKINPIARTLEDPKYRQKVVKSKKKYNRTKERKDQWQK